jgi:hypothetical protein
MTPKQIHRQCKRGYNFTITRTGMTSIQAPAESSQLALGCGHHYWHSIRVSFSQLGLQLLNFLQHRVQCFAEVCTQLGLSWLVLFSHDQGFVEITLANKGHSPHIECRVMNISRRRRKAGKQGTHKLSTQRAEQGTCRDRDSKRKPVGQQYSCSVRHRVRVLSDRERKLASKGHSCSVGPRRNHQDSEIKPAIEGHPRCAGHRESNKL